MDERKVRVAIVGCGNIAGPYAKDLQRYPHVELVGVTDLELPRAATLADEHGCRAYPSVEALLADEAVDLVVNLTIHHAHYAVTTQFLEAGKHVYSEKPLAMRYDEARELVELARQKGVRLGCSPFTWMGEAQQTAWKQIREGRLGTVRLAYAEVNWGRIESWHPAPGPFYQVGALWDVGVYPLTLLTTIFGPARRVWSYGKVLYPDRVTKQGTPFHVETPDFVVTVLELESGVVVRLTTNFYVTTRSKQTGVEFHGDLGSLYLSSWQNFDAAVEFAEFNKPYEPIPLLEEAPEGTPWGRGAAEMAAAMLEGRPHRATGEQAAHVVEILSAAAESMRTSDPVPVSSSFTRPAPMEWADMLVLR
ncbi:MAG: Gfo/Idh/MocA family oxidoreductase [Chloroflexota bacterium]|nr:Gfo/Idh/MocA family oxidoreductase [Chloroflexota bacterium]